MTIPGNKPKASTFGAELVKAFIKDNLFVIS